MAGLTDLDELLRGLNPELVDGQFVFCTVPGAITDYPELEPIATVVEREGLTLILPKSKAIRAGLAFDGVFRQITLTVHSSLEAVGLTAAASRALAAHGVSANFVAGYFHDHIFVPADKAEIALRVLQTLGS